MVNHLSVARITFSTPDDSHHYGIYKKAVFASEKQEVVTWSLFEEKQKIVHNFLDAIVPRQNSTRPPLFRLGIDVSFHLRTLSCILFGINLRPLFRSKTTQPPLLLKHIPWALPLVAAAETTAPAPLRPSWSRPCPRGDIAAVEILANLTHWFKVIDIIDRLVANGLTAGTIARIITRFHALPYMADYPRNSTTKMTQFSIQRTSYGIDWDMTDLDGSDFLNPCSTSEGAWKQARCGDTLDLTRCVLYSIKYSDDWDQFQSNLGRSEKVVGHHPSTLSEGKGSDAAPYRLEAPNLGAGGRGYVIGKVEKLNDLDENKEEEEEEEGIQTVLYYKSLDSGKVTNGEKESSEDKGFKLAVENDDASKDIPHDSGMPTDSLNGSVPQTSPSSLYHTKCTHVQRDSAGPEIEHPTHRYSKNVPVFLQQPYTDLPQHHLIIANSNVFVFTEEGATDCSNIFPPTSPTNRLVGGHSLGEQPAFCVWVDVVELEASDPVTLVERGGFCEWENAGGGWKRVEVAVRLYGEGFNGFIRCLRVLTFDGVNRILEQTLDQEATILLCDITILLNICFASLEAQENTISHYHGHEITPSHGNMSPPRRLSLHAPTSRWTWEFFLRPYTFNCNISTEFLTSTPKLDSTVRMVGHHFAGTFDSFGRNAPSKNVPFPESANITAVELLTFLPLSLKSPDVVFRLISNGGSRFINKIVNTVRELERPWPSNSCGIMLRNTMRQSGYKNWSITTHEKWHKKVAAEWDEKKLNVAGFQTPSEKLQRSPPRLPIPFADLALDVKKFPEGDDALDLTRMVKFAMENPEEEYWYPTDYEKLLKHLGGPLEVKDEHTDRQVFKRWEGVSSPMKPKQTPTPKRKRTPKIGEKRSRGRPRKRLRLTESAEPGSPDLDALESEPELELESSSEVELIPIMEVNKEEKHTESQPRVYKYYWPLQFGFPPPPSESLSDETLSLLFWAEGDPFETDPLSPYAYGGPRRFPPYRELYRLKEPHPDDMSGWAENVRWAKEQAFVYRVGSWNESPDHQGLIFSYRKQQAWYSKEFIEADMKEQEQKKLEGERQMHE
ncbi:uncharacterized protein BDR25DRAFT_392698 [Lindgomyces ingoldianus]|uniref:Uncharacterized protein n=1 Tax=Lindgomyces ingoldianus TaxID=673940 RepID=A0ACB6R2V4_9PLEO|nr:uncharacterized protein BDR25DRAFT_392698 [Lindgomyces ingoldianus]KAF2472842.1 hypothetical protein BDR25DRAFT_392698 [Lindgomyces ingoldianus]